jgi:hypothetical protein
LYLIPEFGLAGGWIGGGAALVFSFQVHVLKPTSVAGDGIDEAILGPSNIHGTPRVFKVFNVCYELAS